MLADDRIGLQYWKGALVEDTDLRIAHRGALVQIIRAQGAPREQQAGRDKLAIQRTLG